MFTTKGKLIVGLAAVALAGGTSTAVAHDYDTTTGSGNYYGGWDATGTDRPDNAASYINPDKGLATFNPDVNANSSCATPDQYDTQKLSDPGTANRNVHNDACFLADGGWSWGGSSSNAMKQDAPASFQATGTGVISACPDPDNAGPKIAILSDTNGDGRKDLCFQSGYQEKGIAGDQEFHARLNNNTTPGTQRVVWCYDENRNGCGDERVKDDITINWVS